MDDDLPLRYVLYVIGAIAVLFLVAAGSLFLAYQRL